MTDDPPHAPATNGLSAPLDGIRIVELGAFIAGPFCGQLLGDLGADILKIEAPGQGDPLRRWGVARKDGKSLWWPVMARNKRSLSIDLRQAEGAALARRVIASADVLIENFKPGTLEGFGLGPELLMADNQRLIIARVSGFGQTGPYAARPGFAAVAEAMAGLRIISGYPDRPPTRSGLSLADSVAGLYAALGVLAALRVRDQTGRGQVIDVALTEAALGISEGIIPEWSATGKVRERSGLAAPGFAPSNIYPCADTTWVVIAANSDPLFRRLATAMGQPRLGDDPRFARHEARGEHQAVLDALIGGWTATLTRVEVIERLIAADVPCGPIYDAADVAADPHFRARQAIVEVEVDGIGRLAMPAVMPRLSQTPGAIRFPGGALGAANRDILQGELGLSDHEMAAFTAKGVI